MSCLQSAGCRLQTIAFASSCVLVQPTVCGHRPSVCTAQALQGGLMDLEAFLETGLLAMSLTGLSAEDADTR